jgi:hypothetical protein
VKIQLVNPLLGSEFDGNGTPDATNGAMEAIFSTGGTQEDDTAAIPGASGCGLLGILDPAVDFKDGLPSASGNNSVVLNNASAFLAGLSSPGSVAPNDGQDLANFWQSAVQS